MAGDELKRGVAGLVLLAALAAAAPAEEAFSFRGYVKSFSILLVPPAATLDGGTVRETDMGAVSNRLRLMFTLRPSKGLSFDAAYDLSPRIQDTRLFSESLFGLSLNLPSYRVADFRNPLYPGPGSMPESFALYHNLDRCMVTIRTGVGDIILGRQPIAWGSARVVNPTDVLAPFAFNELDKEDRTGVDAVRVRVPLGTMDELDAGFVAGDKLRAADNAFYVRGKVNRFKTDISGLVLAFRQNLLLGLDLARSIGGAGAWLEAACVIPGALRPGGRLEGDKDYFRASAGMDYNFGPKTYGFIEYHFNSAGGARPADYASLPGTVAYRDGAVYLLGRHYVSLGTTYQLSALMPFTGLLIVNLTDPSVVFSPSVDYNIAQNIYLAGGAYIGLGRKSEILPTMSPLPGTLFHSEFGAYPDMLYLSFRVYF
jgi:hypothetical protein